MPGSFEIRLAESQGHGIDFHRNYEPRRPDHLPRHSLTPNRFPGSVSFIKTKRFVKERVTMRARHMLCNFTLSLVSVQPVRWSAATTV